MSADAHEPEDEEEEPLVEVVSGAVTALTLLVAFGLMFAGYPFFWVAFVVGFGGVLPMAIGLVKYYQREEGADAARDGRPEPADDKEEALEELRRRYARGEFSDGEFERRVERLLETESLSDAKKYSERIESERQTQRGERELERE